jgi:hypothetical protein
VSALSHAVDPWLNVANPAATCSAVDVTRVKTATKHSRGA